MREADVRAKLATLWASVSGIRTVRAYQPRAIQDSQLPLVVVGIGAAANERDYAEDFNQTREYPCSVYVSKPDAGAEYKAEVDCEAIFAAVEDYFVARPRVKLIDGVGMSLELTKDSGIVLLLMSDKEYAGVVFTLAVTMGKRIRDTGE